jgi:NADPH:quinone reductase-like Zn-dependent oxidoreductase
VSPARGETVVVSAAAGGVGSVVVQLLRSKGVNVLGLASERNHAWLRSHGVTPIDYAKGLAERLRANAPNGIDAFIDLFGPEYVQLAVDLGVQPARIETIISRDKAEELGAKTEGSGDASTTAVLAEMAELVATGQIEIPIAATFPLDQVREAFAELEVRHTHGKIVLIPQLPDG